jgi:hypothetical protein
VGPGGRYGAGCPPTDDKDLRARPQEPYPGSTRQCHRAIDEQPANWRALAGVVAVAGPDERLRAGRDDFEPEAFLVALEDRFR